MKGDYLMTEFPYLLKGGESGETAVVPGKAEISYLIDQIKTDKDGFSEMPKGKEVKPLHSSQFQKIVQWINEGATNDSPEDSGPPYTFMKPLFIKQMADLLFPD
jgi:hypothetical protein